MEIRITKCLSPLYWYANKIGEVFTVTSYIPKDDEFMVEAVGCYVNTDDCEIVHAPRCPHCGGELEG